MSRICVKGLPPYASEDALRKLFASAGGHVTDVKIVRTKAGASRKFAFVGFREAGLEAALVRKFDKAFLETSRLSVEPAAAIGDDSVLQRARSRHTVRKPDVDGTAPADTDKPVPEPMTLLQREMAGVKDPAKLREFMEVMLPRHKGQSWVNDDAPAMAAAAQLGQRETRKRGRDAATRVESDEAMQEDETEAAVASTAAAGSAAAVKAATPAAAGMSDLEYLRSRMTAVFDAEDAAKAEAAGATRKRPRVEDAPVSSADPPKRGQDVDAGETGRLFVRNLPFTASEDDMRDHFGKFGRLADVKVPVDMKGKSKGFGYVTYVIPEHAVLALVGTDGKMFQGRILHVLGAHPAPDVAPAPSATGSGTSYKRSKEAERQAAAGTKAEERSVWSALFVRADTTIAALADRMGIARSDVMDRDGDSMAVRMALAETQIISETKTFLKSEGIDLDALEEGLSAAATAGGAAAATLKRSNCVILVKNLPFTAEEVKLRDLFAKHGSIVRLVLPPSRAVGIVEYADARAAKRAFTNLAYSRFERVPLYLEWAPDKVFTRPAPAPAPVEAPAVVAAATAPVAAAGANAGADAGASSAATGEAVVAAAAEGRTIYVKNVSFESTEEGLRDMFASVGAVRSVKIPRRRNPKHKPDDPSTHAHQQWLSMGYGFVEYVEAADAARAMKTLQGKELDGHSLGLKLSTQQPEEQAAVPVKGKSKGKTAAAATVTAAAAATASASTKLLVRNMAFEATKKDIQELFSAFGAVKTIRVPKKFDGSHRGFAFVEFLTHAEAAAAKEALASTHLYGRHLVLEWAAADDAAAGPK